MIKFKFHPLLIVLCLAASAARGGLETFANFTYTGNSYATNTFTGQDGSTWTCTGARGDIPITGQAPTIRSNVNCYIRSGTLTGGVSGLSFKYRRPFTAAVMSNLVIVAGQNSTFTGVVTEVPATTNDILVFSATNLNVEGDFVLAISNKAGSARVTIDDIEWTGYSASLSAPVFTSAAAFGATVAVASAFTVAAAGNPAPALALQDTTASGGYSFAAATGQLSYTPPAEDQGTQTFTFTASNSQGVATQAVSVTVAGPPVYIPAVTVTNIGTNGFTVLWTAVTDASAYEVQVGTDSNFTAEVAGTNVLNESFAALTFSAVPAGWSNSASSDLAYTTEPMVGQAAPAYKFGTTGQWLLSPVFAAGATNLQFWAAGRNQSGSIYTISGLVAGVWTLIDTVSIARTEATYNVPLNPQTTRIKYTFTRVSSCGLDDVVVQTAATAGSTVLNETVAALSYGATGLNVATPYYVRVRAATGTWSAVILTATANTNPVAPWFTGGSGPYSATAGVAVAFTETALGTPAPGLALAAATVPEGTYVFTPGTGAFTYTPLTNHAGDQIFTFTASNSMGVATQVVTVSVAPATLPVFSPLAVQSATTGVNKAFTVAATGVPEPVLAMLGTTASSGYSFSPDTGRLSYTPPTNDVGTRTFTFAAGNIAGTATQIVTVVVSNAPATPPVVAPIPAQSMLVSNTLNYTVTAVPTDGDPILFYTCTSTVATAVWTFNTNSGVFAFTPAAAQIGSNAFYFTATDKDGASAAVRLTVVVNTSADPVAVSFGQVRIVGEEGGAAIAIPVKLAYAGTAAVQVRFSGPTNGTARWGADFSCETNLTIAGAAEGDITVNVVNDYLAEGPESVLVTLVPVAPATAGAVTQAVLVIRDDDTVSIVAANITTGSQEYEDPGNRIFQALNPDVALIQEFNLTNGTTEAAYSNWVSQNFGTNYYFFHEPVASASIPNGIVSRWPISQSGEWDDTALSDRDFVWAKIDLPGSLPLYAVSVHLKASSGYESTRTTEARALTNHITTNNWLTNGYVVVGGDFNLQVRTETALQVLTNKIFSDRHPAADQFGDKDTNSGRDNPYDNVLPSTNLDARHRPFAFYGYTFTNGLVFDTRLTWANGLPPPALAADSADANMQHMAVLKVFELEKDAVVDVPQAFAAAAAGRSQIDLSFTRNPLGDDVIVVWNGTGVFATPTGAAPGAGAAFAGGTVLYQGNVSPQSHAGLTGCATYYYKCWSFAGTNYSATGLAASATTGGPDAPAAAWASATNLAAFTAAWSPVAGVTNYRLDAATNAGFTPAAAYVSGYSNRLVSGAASAAVTGLTSGATYYFRVRAVEGNCTSGNSPTGTVATHALSNQTISFPAIGPQTATAAVALAATASSGLPVGFAVGSGPASISGGSNLTFTGAGTVSIVASQAGDANWNPAPNVTNSFAVTKAAATVTLAGLQQTYDGTPRSATATTAPGGLAVVFTYDGSAAAPTAAGGYAVTGTVNEARYAGSAAGTLVIAKAAATVTLENLLQAYDGAPKSVTATTVPPGLAVVITYDGSPTAPSAAGSYAVTGTVSDANYTGAVADTLNITNALTPFKQWLVSRSLDPQDARYAPDADDDHDGATTEEEFLADTDPALAGSVFVITGAYDIAAAPGGTGQIRLAFPASTARYYQLEYCLDLTNHIIGTSNLGWGVPGMVVTGRAPGTWYGVIRSRLAEP